MRLLFDCGIDPAQMKCENMQNFRVSVSKVHISALHKISSLYIQFLVVSGNLFTTAPVNSDVVHQLLSIH